MRASVLAGYGRWRQVVAAITVAAQINIMKRTGENYRSAAKGLWKLYP